MYSIFQPAHIPNVGSFQDGGLKHNNPVNLALWESRYIWPSVNQPDLVLSLGTGTVLSDSASAPGFRHILKDGFLPRLYRSFMSSLDGQRAWRDLVNRLDEDTQDDYIRLNISLPDPEPKIDAVDKMDSLRQSVHLQSQGNEESKHAFALLSSQFFFKLQALPQKHTSGLYSCQGFVCCKIGGFAIVEALKRVHPEELSWILDDQTVASMDMESDVCSLCHRYRKKIEFFLQDLETPLAISLRGTDDRSRRISAFPRSMKWFIEQQKLDVSFGTMNHGIPGRLTCRGCEQEKVPLGQKRKAAWASPLRKRMKSWHSNWI